MNQKAAKGILYAVSVPILLFEYFVLTWFWGGADTFNFILTPVVFVIYLITVFFVNKKIKVKSSLASLMKLLYAVILPILTMATVQLAALIFGIDIVVW